VVQEAEGNHGSVNVGPFPGRQRDSVTKYLRPFPVCDAASSPQVSSVATMSWRYWALLALCVGTGSKVRAQTSDVTTCVDAMKWVSRLL